MLSSEELKQKVLERIDKFYTDIHEPNNTAYTNEYLFEAGWEIFKEDIKLIFTE